VKSVALFGLIVAGCSGIAPLPYTVDQLRAASPAGRTITLRRETKGAPASLHVVRFVTVDEEGAEIETLEHVEGGAPLEAPKRFRVAWEELLHHADFPRDATTIEDGVIETPGGTFAVSIYTVKEGADVSRYYFAKDRAGPPVLYYMEQGGRRVMTSVLAR
jgi:hypothetical protein